MTSQVTRVSAARGRRHFGGEQGLVLAVIDHQLARLGVHGPSLVPPGCAPDGVV